MNNDNIYWLFSAAAQSVAAFIALLLAGYALVHALLESARTRDDTLDEIHIDLRRTTYRRLQLLAWVNGAAIVLSLIVVYLNKWEFSGKAVLMVLAAAVDVAAMAGGLVFVVKIVDPARYEQAAARALKENAPELDLSGEAVPKAEFIEKFKQLGRAMRELLANKDTDRSETDPAARMSFRAVLDALAAKDLIESALHEQLAHINRYRNLIYHGHFPQADRAMVDRVNRVTEQIRRLA